MNLDTIFLMRTELLLIFQIVFLIVYDLFVSDSGKKKFDLVACSLFVITTIIGFFPIPTGSAFGGMYISDPMSTVVKSILNIGVILVFLQSKTWLNDEYTSHKKSEVYILILSTLAGMDLMISSGHFLIFYIGLELASLPLVALIAYNKYSQESVEAGAKFVLMAAFSSGMLLFGISMLYGSAGEAGLYFDAMCNTLSPNSLQLLGMVFFISGLAFKISLVPFHLWTADVYQGAPTNITAFLSVISKGAAVFALTLVLFKVFGNLADYWKYIVYGLIIVTITIGNLFAMRQKNMKRFLAFSSISQAGYIMLGVLAGTPAGMSSVVYYLLVYMVSNLGAFAVVSIIENNSGKQLIADYNGLYQTNPKLSVAMMLFLFSLAGIPPFAGFFSKFFVFMAAAEMSYYLLVFIALLNTVISLYYYLLVIKAMFINKNDNPIAAIKTDNYSRIGLTICLAGTLLLGIISYFYGYIEQFAFGII
ncbi:MAG: NADH-quinone oxidoreductase subunit N [Bacteroidales bacterium]